MGSGDEPKVSVANGDVVVSNVGNEDAEIPSGELLEDADGDPVADADGESLLLRECVCAAVEKGVEEADFVALEAVAAVEIVSEKL